MKRLPRLYAVADSAFGDVVMLAGALVDGGAELIQLRHKGASSRTLLHEAEAILKIAPANVRLIVNDRADVARLAGAHGVHVGQDDLAPELVKKVLNKSQCIGRSTHNVDQALDADQGVADYIAVGPVFATSTKTAPDPALGLQQLQSICAKIEKPVVAIGGITLESAADVIDCGVASIAVISDILRFGNRSARVREWIRVLETEPAT